MSLGQTIKVVLLLLIAALHFPARSQNTPAPSLALKPTGKTILQYEESSSSQNRDVELPQSAPLQAPTLIGEFTQHYMMNKDLERHMDAHFMSRLQEYSLYNGYYVTDQDKPFSPMGFTLAEEAALRADMANSMKGYFLMRALPQFLKKKTEKNHLVGTTTQAFETMQNFKLYSQKKSEKTPLGGQASPEDVIVNPWEMSAGLTPRAWDAFVPIQWEAWTRLSNGRWSFHAVEAFGIQNRRLTTSYSEEHWTPALSYSLTKRVATPSLQYRWSHLSSIRFFLNAPLSNYAPLKAADYHLEYSKKF